MIRDNIKAALVGAMKAGDKPRTGAIRLIQAALKNRDIELRGAANPPEDDVLVTEVLQKMIKQRRESIDMYEQGRPRRARRGRGRRGRGDRGFLPTQMGEAELGAAVDAIVAETGAPRSRTWAG